MRLKFIKYFLVVTVMAAFASCEKKLQPYDNGSGLNFLYATPADTLINYSFALGAPAATIDTVWLGVETIGPVSDVNREVALEQVLTGLNDAEPGKHFVPLTDPDIKRRFVVPARQTIARLPIVFKRDVSLKTNTYSLKLRIKLNDSFTFSNPTRTGLRISLNDQLAKPVSWGTTATSTYLGAYGVVKHAWLREQTGGSWDNNYLLDLGFTATGTNANFDTQYALYLRSELKKKLSAYNAAQIAAGKDVLKEANGTVVTFPG
ncbi:DUF4843 domain-containing protein [Pedobacter sp. MC2016-14]|uniref:DUF4843 domain-containing protein n=1 Tax=Pedobacter sp. MC2016-14 TaxID=2897327 RepID=UPI001E2CE6F6|nr:DUF4843 domain-containing protein [Pedobacter sp. MC2016-14]MCD0486697.1 DUF4843 domain-containing protein [Pedobacter sp. MC2016-14]